MKLTKSEETVLKVLKGELSYRFLNCGDQTTTRRKKNYENAIESLKQKGIIKKGNNDVLEIVKKDAKKTFIISPVKNIAADTIKQLLEIMRDLEADGYIVHLPAIHTNQFIKEVDICKQNIQAIKAADLVCIWFDENSIGSVFDLGVTVSHNKTLRILNHIERTSGKSFANMVLDYASQHKK
jgi:hypothetical protein